MNELRLDDYLEQIESAARRALEFVGAQSREEFLADIKTQHAVAMSFAVMGTQRPELLPRILTSLPERLKSVGVTCGACVIISFTPTCGSTTK